MSTKSKFKVTYTENGELKELVATKLTAEKFIESFQWRKGFNLIKFVIIESNPEEARNQAINLYKTLKAN